MSQQSNQKNTSLNTINALVNSMLGGTMLTLPLLFRDSGIVTSFVILVISGFISLTTCNVYIKHLGAGQLDIQDSIKRILKGKWYEFFCIISGVYLIMLNMLYIVLINDQLYSVISYLVLKTHGNLDSIAMKNEFTFSKFSQQYLAIITFLPLLALLLIKNLNFLIRLTAIGVWSVAIYIVFVFYVFIDNSKSIRLSEIKMFSWDIGDLAGTCALAFTIHTVVAPIMKNNRFQQKNTRDLSISYIIGTVVYSFVGICGCMAIYNKSLCEQGAQTIIDCFPNGNWQPFIVSIVYLFGRITVFPCFMDVSRQRIFQAFSKDPIPEKKRHIFNIGFMLFAFLFEFLSPYIKLADIMNFTGAIFCFFFVYLIPIALHLKCYYTDQSSSDLAATMITNSQGTSLIQQHQTCPHTQKSIDAINQHIRYAFYGVLLFIGLATMVYGLYSSVRLFV